MQAVLFDHCLRRAHEKEFFIRKAIGWVLREYAKTAPDALSEFVFANRDVWSGLTFREATKHLVRSYTPWVASPVRLPIRSLPLGRRR